MAENGGSDTATRSDGGSSASADKRLEAELNTTRAEFETLAAEAGGDDESKDSWIARGRQLLDNADEALKNRQIEQGWSYLHAAQRLGIYGLESVDGMEALRGEARELLVEAENAPLGWRTEALRERIATTDGTLRENLTADDVRAAHELLHAGYESVHRKRQHLQSQFRYLQIGALATVVIFLLVAAGGSASGLLPTPFFDFDSAGSTGAEIVTGPVGFLVYVVLAGTLGATLFGLRSLRGQSGSGSTPQYLSGFQAMTARIVVGAGSALAVFFFVRSDLLTIGGVTGQSQGPFLIAIAFAAGYSQRLVHSTVEAVGDAGESSASGGGEDS